MIERFIYLFDLIYLAGKAKSECTWHKTRKESLKEGCIYPVHGWQRWKIHSPQLDYSHPSLCKCPSRPHSLPAHVHTHRHNFFFPHYNFEWDFYNVIKSKIKGKSLRTLKLRTLHGNSTSPGSRIDNLRVFRPACMKEIHIYTQHYSSLSFRYHKELCNEFYL